MFRHPKCIISKNGSKSRNPSTSGLFLAAYLCNDKKKMKMDNNRRSFLKASTFVSGALLTPTGILNTQNSPVHNK